MKLIKKDTQNNYILYNLNYIKNNHNHFVEYANLAHKRFQFAFGKTAKSSTQYFRYYNFFQLVSGSTYYHKLYEDLIKIIKDYVNTNEKLWLQCWINYHKKNEVLDWHYHKECLLHGYISILPQNTETHFEKYKIKNTIGNLYIGEPNKNHKVVNLSDFDDIRITLGFDVLNEKYYKDLTSSYGQIDINLSYFPI